MQHLRKTYPGGGVLGSTGFSLCLQAFRWSRLPGSDHQSRVTSHRLHAVQSPAPHRRKGEPPMTFSTRKTVWQMFRLAVLPAALFCFAAGLGAQEKDNSPKKPESKVATVEVTPAEATAEVGDTLQFTAVGKDASGNAQPDKPTVWFAAPFDTGGADMSGKVRVFGAGEVTVGAVIGGKVGYAKIHIKRPHIARIEVAPLSAPVVAGGTAQALATPRNANGEPRSDIAIAWTSENSAVARVDAAGLVTGVSPGRAKIRAAGDGEVVRGPGDGDIAARLAIGVAR